MRGETYAGAFKLSSAPRRRDLPKSVTERPCRCRWALLSCRLTSSIQTLVLRMSQPPLLVLHGNKTACRVIYELHRLIWYLDSSRLRTPKLAAQLYAGSGVISSGLFRVKFDPYYVQRPRVIRMGLVQAARCSRIWARNSTETSWLTLRLPRGVIWRVDPKHMNIVALTP